MNIIPISDMERMAQAVSKSGLFGIKQPEQALALMLIAQAEGLHPAAAARDYHLVQGRPALKADAMLARFQAAGGKVNWISYTDDEVKATFSHPAGGSVTLAWTIAQAKAAGLTNKDVWRQYPRAMLRARVISEGIRTVYPGVAVGVYTPEEISDFDTKREVKEVSSDSVSITQAAQAVKESVSISTPKVEAEPKAPKPSSAQETTGPDSRETHLARIKASGWTRLELAQFAAQAFQVKEASKLSTEQLGLMCTLVTTRSFDQAMKQITPEIEADDDKI